MSAEFYAVIGAFLVYTVALLGFFFQLNGRQSKLAHEQTKQFDAVRKANDALSIQITELLAWKADQTSKMSLIWGIYVQDVLAARRDHGLTETLSAEKVSAKWFDLVPESLRFELQASIDRRVGKAAAYDVSMDVVLEFREDLFKVSRNSNLPMSSIISVIQLLVTSSKGL